MITTIAEAAARLGMKESEIADVTARAEGVVVTTSAGVQHIDVPDDCPDGDGKTGLMFWRLPDPDRTYAYPCWVAPKGWEDDLVADAEEGDALEVPDGSVDEVLDWVIGGDDDAPAEGWEARAVAARAAEEARPRPRKGVLEGLDDLVADAEEGDD